MILKICGITRLADAEDAVRLGATALGFVFWPASPRAITAARAAEIVAALPPIVTTVGVFVNESPAIIRQTVTTAGISMVQLHGDESVEDAAVLQLPVIRAVTLEAFEAARAAWPDDTTFLLDAADPLRRGGTGRRVDWAGAAEVARRSRVILAGGLTPGNVGEAVATVRPLGVDVSSGVEEAPGVKDAAKMARFLASAREALAECERLAVERR